MQTLLTTEQIQARVAEMGARDRARLSGRRGHSSGRRAQGRIHVHGRSRPRHEPAGDARFHRRVELRQEHQVVGRGPDGQGPRRRPRGPSRHHRRGHRRHRADADLPAGHPARARAEVAQDRVPAEQAVAAQGRGRRSTTWVSRSRIGSSSATGSTTRRSIATSATSRCWTANEALRDHHRGRRPDARDRVDRRARAGRHRHAARAGTRCRRAGSPSSPTGTSDPQLPPDLAPVADVRRVAIGSDHSGVALKRALVQHLRGRGLAVTDVGTDGTDPVDYPDIAAAVGPGGCAQGGRRGHRHRRRRHRLGHRRQQDSRHPRRDVPGRDHGAILARAQRRQRPRAWRVAAAGHGGRHAGLSIGGWARR